MIYPTGETIEIGDTVALGGDRRGVVVGIIDEGRYAAGYPANDWQYLHNGLVVSTDFGDLRLDQPDEDLTLVARVTGQYRRLG
jgi:hypothetical protein